MQNRQDDYQLIIDGFKKSGRTKSFVTAVLARFAVDYDFLKILNGFYNENVLRRDTIGVIYSDEYDEYDEGYFGEDRVLFYFGVDEDWYDILTYDELCEYLQVVCEIYADIHEDKAKEVYEYMDKIKKKYGVM
ncbi:ribonuclease toxin immunity protein CdiI [Terribacillus saccharophilus]|uniref:CDI immunity protein domain-containing protein n=1 Tax=Terribacillus saccharophilus TaxID=361277 RepID=A0AAX2EGU1_9BACI|nr:MULTISPECIES: ribonuclease toxin immunity protein CdiI [Terribacillus]MCM3225701.1 ribonuclease toxin immunity protein CdiI [Terribacillus saccharophilus]MEC0281588.1 ribonuclease toxin immunity protein CdiI [Terribacillus saccharophilus]MEC0291626.1 ribonuclease toxin immunity protein CdiI [Terribacillus saccharophilus]SEN48500.1 hypothetical protein SAMN04489762_2363 [Terribacillus saccharophilus]